jgi:hypothetical protein
LEIIPENNLADQCTDLYIVCLSVFLASSLPFGFSWGGFWWQVLNQSCKIFFPICLYICATFSVLLTLDKTWWEPQLCSKGRVTTSVSRLLLFDPVINPDPDPGTK